MATVNDDYIKSNYYGKLYKWERHNIVGNKNGDDDEKEVYRRNEENNHPGSTIRNKYTCHDCKQPDYSTKEQLKKFFTTSSKEAYDGTKQRAEENNKDAAKKAKLRPVYDKEFRKWSPEYLGNENKARRAGWIPFEEWFANKKAGKPMYSQSELNSAPVDALNRKNNGSSIRQHVKKKR